MKKIELAEGIFVIKDFLSGKECDDLINFSENQGYNPAKVNIHGRERMMTMVRNNERVLHKDEDFAQTYWEKLKPHCNEQIGNRVPVGLNEMFRFYKYGVHQRFKRHRDGSFVRNTMEKSLLTFMVYLNDDFEGGTTEFDDIEINPKQGMALIFDHELKHEGKKIISGFKYVLRSDIMYRLIE